MKEINIILNINKFINLIEKNDKFIEKYKDDLTFVLSKYTMFIDNNDDYNYKTIDISDCIDDSRELCLIDDDIVFKYGLITLYRYMDFIQKTMDKKYLIMSINYSILLSKNDIIIYPLDTPYLKSVNEDIRESIYYMNHKSLNILNPTNNLQKIKENIICSDYNYIGYRYIDKNNNIIVTTEKYNNSDIQVFE